MNSYGRLKISIFHGEDTNWWVSEAEKIFSRNQFSEAEKIEDVIACFDGEAWDWFQQVDRYQPVQTWGEVKRLMLERFCFSPESTKLKFCP